MNFKEVWKKLENTKTPPTRVNKIFTENFIDFRDKIIQEKDDFVNRITKSLYDGDIYILKNSFSENFLNDLKIKCYEHFKNIPSSFHKMIQNCPDFHRQIDLDSGKKYSFKVCKHSFFFYHWNNDPLNIFPEVYKRWRIFKYFARYFASLKGTSTRKRNNYMAWVRKNPIFQLHTTFLFTS